MPPQPAEPVSVFDFLLRIEKSEWPQKPIVDMIGYREN
jgi:hypothetical protein